jgi:DNA-binding GntR family transcriptional regulator
VRASKQSSPSPAARAAATEIRVGVADVVSRLRERISSHAIAPGSRLREWDVATEFDVPRLLAREALDRLTQLGFVDRQPNRGVVVHRFRHEEILQLYDMREANEGLCARLAARNARPESWDDLIELFDTTMEKVVEQNDFDAYSTHYERLRTRLIEAAASPPLADLLERLNDMTRIAGRRMLLVSDRTRHALREHRAVLAALRAGDQEAAERLRRATIRNVKDAVDRYHAFLL